MVFSYDQPWPIVFRLWSDAFIDKVVNPLMLKYEKKVEGERTSTHVTPLDLEGRVQEIARIMAGDSPSKLMLQSAREALQQAQEAE